MGKTGIYKIESIEGKIYIGSAVNVHTRIIKHLYTLRNNIHCNQRLQNYFNKYGEAALTFSTLEYCDKEKLIEREQYYIDALNPYFNICRRAGNTLGQPGGMKGRQTSEFQKQRVREIHTGKITSEETKQKIREKALLRPGYWKGKKLPKEVCLKIATARKGQILSPERMEKLTFKGRTHTEDHKKYMSNILTGRKFSDETREKLRQAQLGRKQDPETIRKREETKRKNRLNG